MNDQDVLQHSISTVVVPGYLYGPGEGQAPQVKESHLKRRFIRQELQQLKKKVAVAQRMSGRKQQALFLVGVFLRFSSAVATGMLLWLYTIRQDTCYVAWECPKIQ